MVWVIAVLVIALVVTNLKTVRGWIEAFVAWRQH